MKTAVLLLVIGIVAPLQAYDWQEDQRNSEEEQYHRNQLKIQSEQADLARQQLVALHKQNAILTSQATRDSASIISDSDYIPRSVFSPSALLYMGNGNCTPISKIGNDGFIAVDNVKPCPH